MKHQRFIVIRVAECDLEVSALRSQLFDIPDYVAMVPCMGGGRGGARPPSEF